MKPPCEQFVLQTFNSSVFQITVTSPEAMRQRAHVSEDEIRHLTVERYLFIYDAIREKLERGEREEK